MNHKYKKGGEVKVSGKWYKITESDGNTVRVDSATECRETWLFDEFIEDYREPEMKPYEWFGKANFIHPNEYPAMLKLDQSARDLLNKYLTETYGDPAERVYKGESADEFGLDYKSDVLCKHESGRWANCCFGLLTLGDIWRKQPPILSK